ncbi:MAG TPA: hypothetical protein DEA55_03430 [Rhodospirillaceae bacterium]|nr:hypothetical protein [Rhodospirillaceae bacterium]
MKNNVTKIKKADPLLSGFYTVRDASRLFKIDSQRKIRGWLDGHANSASPPVIERTHNQLGKINEISFLDLMEIRFINYYRQRDIPLQTLRVAAQAAREELKTTHPFALSGIRFMNERKKIFLETADELGDKKLLNLVTKQFQIYQVIEQILELGVEFDDDGMAKQFFPNRELAPNVYLNPHFAFGQPVVGDGAVPTSAIFKTYQAEEGNIKKVSTWYDVPEAHIIEAIRFEASLAT